MTTSHSTTHEGSGAGAPTVLHVVGARPNFVKMAPLVSAMRARDGIENILVHTGQHYDERMSSEILEDLGLPLPDHHLGIGSGTHGAQTARALSACEELMLETQPDLVVVAGDVNSTLAAALAASKLGIPVAHLESGLRSRDWTMPEEINRVLTDRLSDVLLTHSPEAEGNLAAEGIDLSRVHLVGNTMIDSLREYEADAVARGVWERFGAARGEYVLVTLHRPSNVDDPGRLQRIAHELGELARRHTVLFPVHPRTRAGLVEQGLVPAMEEAGVQLLGPLGYLDFLSLEIGSGAVLTDSGGIQEETSALGIPCFTLRANTERPVTVTHGTNVLLGDDPDAIAKVTLDGDGSGPDGGIPLWDGHAAERAADVLCEFLKVPSREEVRVVAA